MLFRSSRESVVEKTVKKTDDAAVKIQRTFRQFRINKALKLITKAYADLRELNHTIEKAEGLANNEDKKAKLRALINLRDQIQSKLELIKTNNKSVGLSQQSAPVGLQELFSQGPKGSSSLLDIPDKPSKANPVKLTGSRMASDLFSDDPKLDAQLDVDREAILGWGSDLSDPLKLLAKAQDDLLASLYDYNYNFLPDIGHAITEMRTDRAQGHDLLDGRITSREALQQKIDSVHDAGHRDFSLKDIKAVKAIVMQMLEEGGMTALHMFNHDPGPGQIGRAHV